MTDLLVSQAVQAHGLRKMYRAGTVDVVALNDVDVTIESGSFVALMGPSGAGKTTLLNCLSGLDDVTAGTVAINGVELDSLSDAERTLDRARSMGFVFQAFNLIPVLSAIENVELPLLLAGVPGKRARASAEATLAHVGLAARGDHRPAQLSGGEQQRVAVARAIAGDPQIVWADEPTGNLDAESAELVLDLLSSMHRDGVTIVLVTHSLEVSARAERTITMRDGRIAADETVR